MARERIGVVTEVIGRVTAAADGVERILQTGDAVRAGDMLVTAPGAYVVIRFADGSLFDLAGGASMVLDEEVYDPEAVAAEQPLIAVEDIQALLRAGGDPTDPEAGIEATAAGPQAGPAEGNEGSSIVVRVQEDVRVDPESGIQTSAAILDFPLVDLDELPVPLPGAEAPGEHVTVPEAVPVNLVLLFDRSSSMAREALGETQLDVAKAAVGDLLRAYSASGAMVNVLVVDFARTAASSGWIGVDDALARIGGFEVSPDTNYRAALELVQSSFGTPPAPGQTVVWFFSDGEPWPADGSPPVENGGRTSYELTPADVEQWQAFLQEHGAQAFAIGVRGEWTDWHEENLAEVASPDGEVILLTHVGQLGDAAVDGVDHRIEGNVLDNDADGTGLVSLAVDDVIYRYDAASEQIVGSDGTTMAGSTLELTTALGGLLTFSFADDGERQAGEYTYLAPSVDGDRSERFIYVVEDEAGELASSTLRIDVLDRDGSTSMGPVLLAEDLLSDETAGFNGAESEPVSLEASFAEAMLLSFSRASQLSPTSGAELS